MWDHLLMRCPPEAAEVCSSVLSRMQEALQAPEHPAGQAPAAADAQATGTTSSSAHGMEVEQAKTAAALSGPDNVGKACDLSIALSLLSCKPGGGSSSQRYAMLSAALQAWPDDARGVLGLMLLEDVVLSPGGAALIPADMPHAYICGELSGSLGVLLWAAPDLHLPCCSLRTHCPTAYAHQERCWRSRRHRTTPSRAA
jgi:hypothetical protein